MSFCIRRSSAFVAGLLVIATAAAQGPASAPAARPDPLDARAAVPRLVHRPAFAGYQPAGEVKVGSWKDANETVNRLGGWRAYAREAGTPTPAASAPASASAPTAPASPRAASAPAAATASPAASGAAVPGHRGHAGHR